MTTDAKPTPAATLDLDALESDITGWCQNGDRYRVDPDDCNTVEWLSPEDSEAMTFAECHADEGAPFLATLLNAAPALIARAREAEALRADLAARDSTIAELRAALGQALDIADEGWAYAEDYFRDKHLDTEQMARLRALANPNPTEG